jgi:hypothetical protein
MSTTPAAKHQPHADLRRSSLPSITSHTQAHFSASMVSTAPVQRFSWFLPYLQTRHRLSPSSSSSPAAMDPDQATFWLSQLIGKTLRIHASDGRVFVGTFKCTDKVHMHTYTHPRQTADPPPPGPQRHPGPRLRVPCAPRRCRPSGGRGRRRRDGRAVGQPLCRAGRCPGPACAQD